MKDSFPPTEIVSPPVLEVSSHIQESASNATLSAVPASDMLTHSVYPAAMSISSLEVVSVILSAQVVVSPTSVSVFRTRSVPPSTVAGYVQAVVSVTNVYPTTVGNPSAPIKALCRQLS